MGGDIIKIKSGDEIKEMRNYLKKPIIISAKQINKEFMVESMGGIARGKPGDYLVKDEDGEIYPCDRKLFEEIYHNIKKIKEACSSCSL